MTNFKIVLLARDCDSSAIVYNYLKQFFRMEAIVLEETLSKRKQMLKRAKRLGWWTAAGQAAFMVIVYPLLKIFSRKRKKEIFGQYGLSNSPLPEELIARVKSLNTAAARELLQKLKPDLLLVNGTRIISKKTLEAVPAPFINIHVGITPLFRGVHGGYWAVATGRKDFFGSTIHYVDTGVDTGGIIEQVFISPGKKDNFYTYPYLKYAMTLPTLKKVVESFVSGTPPPTRQPVTNESSVWYHPTIFQWLKYANRTMIFIFIAGVANLF
jgi:hypothetical protein